MKGVTVKELYTLEETIAKDIFEGVEYPWEVLPKISSFILELGNSLSAEEYDKIGDNVWIAKSANVKTSFCSIKYRCLIIIMSGILFWDINPIWGQDLLLPM